MIEAFRSAHAYKAKPHVVRNDAKINVVVRKRPSSDRERETNDHDAVTCLNPIAVVHNCKFKVDGITKILENTSFEFDHVFDELASNDDVYDATCRPLLDFVVSQDGRGTVFAYGQTGSGKTFTMQGLTERAARDLFRLARKRTDVKQPVRARCSLFELYGPQCLDLLNERRVCAVREDGQGDVHIEGLREIEVSDEEQFLTVLAEGSMQRTTRSTEMNADSSRSHAIFSVTLSTGGKLSLIDLAGSERGQDTRSHDATRRNESAAINKSLLALKECIRALDPSSGATRVPYRGSKLTMVLKDSFADHARTVMVSCVSPASSSSDHTLNTLRYADRIKEKVVGAVSASSSGAGSPPHVSSAVAAAFSGAKSPGGVAVRPAGVAQNVAKPRSKSPGPGVATATGMTTATVVPFASRPTSTATMAAKSPGPAMRAAGAGKSLVARAPSAPAHQNVPVSTNVAVVAESASDSFADASADALDDIDEDEDLSPEHRRILREVRQRPSTGGGGVAGAVTTAAAPAPAPARRSLPQIQHASVQALIDEEEQVLAAHLDSVRRNASYIQREGELLALVQGTTDWDVEEYVRELESLLTEKIGLFSALRDKVVAFRQHLAMEADSACL